MFTLEEVHKLFVNFSEVLESGFSCLKSSNDVVVDYGSQLAEVVYPEWLLYYQRLSMGLEVEVASFCSWILSNRSCNGTKFLNAALEIAVSIAVF